jgi:hypothetical protein
MATAARFCNLLSFTYFNGTYLVRSTDVAVLVLRVWKSNIDVDKQMLKHLELGVY